MVERVQNLVIGSGEGGKVLAWQLAGRGEKTVVVERKLIGGSCPNVACLPSKNVLYSAKVVHLALPKSGLGVLRGEMTVDMHAVLKRKQQMVAGLIDVHLSKFHASGAELVMGTARFIGPKTVEVQLADGGTQQYSGDRVFLNLGSRASIPHVPGLAATKPMTHVEALDLERLPQHLVVLGGGYVGLEFAQALRRFGSQVTIIQRAKHLLDREDPDVSDALAELMHDEGCEVLLDSTVSSVSGHSGQHVNLEVHSGGITRLIPASDILVATGRTPNTDTIDAERGGVALDVRGYIQVNERLETSAAGVWAVGDCAGSPQFTHVGYDDFRVVFDNLNGGQRTTHGRLVPYCLFTDPELAHVGMHEREARASGVAHRVFRQPMSAVLRTRTLGQTRGFAKALVGSDDRILGFTAFGAEASEMLAAVQTAMLGELPYTVLRDAIFTHPTASEGLIGLFSGKPAE